jgi:hypothetical protein
MADTPRYFDHILSTPDLPIRAVTYDHTVRTGEDPISDHSLVLATFTPLGQDKADRASLG